MKTDSSKSKIIQVLYSGLGGHGTVAFSLVESFYLNNYENIFVFFGIESVNPNYIDEINSNNYIFGHKEIVKEKNKNFYSWIKYYKIISDIKPKVILLHSNQLILITWFYKLFNEVKIISVEHDSLSDRNKRKWIVSNFNSILADDVIVLHKGYKDKIKENLWFKNLIKKYHVIPNGIDIEMYKPIIKNRNGKINLFMASRMNKLRDHYTLIEAVIVLKRKYDVNLKIAGYGESFDFYYEKYGKLDFVEFLGNISQTEIIDELNKTDVYIHATFAETFSTSILQAMSCGLPIIVSNIEGTVHMIQNGINGLTYNNKNILDLVTSIENVLINQELAFNLGVNARKDVISLYDIREVTKQYLSIMNK